MQLYIRGCAGMIDNYSDFQNDIMKGEIKDIIQYDVPKLLKRDNVRGTLWAFRDGHNYEYWNDDLQSRRYFNLLKHVISAIPEEHRSEAIRQTEILHSMIRDYSNFKDSHVLEFLIWLWNSRHALKSHGVFNPGILPAMHVDSVMYLKSVTGFEFRRVDNWRSRRGAKLKLD